jgi:hypothetical protein
VAVGFLLVLAIFVILVEVWYAVAFYVAYLQLRDRMVLLPMLQALLMLAAFAYIVVALLNQWPISLVVVVGLLIAAMLVSLYWRRSPGGLAALLRSFPRGTIDVLSFRRPAVDLKRRVRTK